MTLAIIGFGLAAFVIVLALVGAWAVHSHEDEYQDEYKAGEENLGDW